jgi:UDP-GlcNAc:undecaprenyl-phosphate GlcNAc-1-phosphate transferase
MLAALLDREWPAAVLVAAGAVSAALVPVVRSLAYRLGVLDRPKQGKMHTGATPYLGGVAIGLAALVLPMLLAGWHAETAWVLLGAAMVCVTGLVDDLRSLMPAPRLAVEAAAALIAVLAGAEVQLFGNWLDTVVSTVWLVVITNSFNLLDNMDGVAATVAVGIAVPLAGAAVAVEAWPVAAVTAALIGACIGFLYFNWHPASIFMGDAGSLLIGFLLAASAMRLSSGPWAVDGDGAVLIAVVGVVLAMGVAVLDTTLVVVSRTRAGRSIMVGGTDHISHRLHRLGMPIRVVALSLGLAGLATSTLGVLVLRDRVHPLVALVPVVAVGVVLFARLIRLPVYAEGAGRTS